MDFQNILNIIFVANLSLLIVLYVTCLYDCNYDVNLILILILFYKSCYRGIFVFYQYYYMCLCLVNKFGFFVYQYLQEHCYEMYADDWDKHAEDVFLVDGYLIYCRQYFMLPKFYLLMINSVITKIDTS